LRIAIGHHNFESISEEDTSPLRNVRELRKFLFKNNFRFFFHGHQHIYEYSEWIDDDSVISAIGCGSVSATPSELPSGSNQMTILKIGEAFGKIYSHTYNITNKSWSLSEIGPNLPLPTSKSIPFSDKEQVSKASKDLIKYATKSIQQTFISSAFPGKEDDPILSLDFNSNVVINRIISIDEYAGIKFAESHLDVEEKIGNNLQLNYVESDAANHPPFNFLLVDESECLISLSQPAYYDSSGIYLSSNKAVSDLTRFLPHIRLSNRPRCSPITREVLNQKSDQILQHRPFSLADSFITTLIDKYKGQEKISYIGIIGSSAKKEVQGTKLNDIDILLIVKGELEANFVRELKDFVKKEIRKRNEDNDSQILLIPEYRDAPLRPAPQGKKTIYQLHILLHDENQPKEWPAFIRKSRILLHKTIKGELENYITIDENLFSEMLNNETWSFQKMREYCEKEYMPSRMWDIDSITHEVKDNIYNLDFKENWEIFEFLAYCCTKSLSNFLVAIGTEEAINFNEDEIITAVQPFIEQTIVEQAQIIMKAKVSYRKLDITHFPDKEILKYKEMVISILEYMENLVKNDYL